MLCPHSPLLPWQARALCALSVQSLQILWFRAHSTQFSFITWLIQVPLAGSQAEWENYEYQRTFFYSLLVIHWGTRRTGHFGISLFLEMANKTAVRIWPDCMTSQRAGWHVLKMPGCHLTSCGLDNMLVLVHLMPWSSRLVGLAASAPMAVRVIECGLWQTILLQNILYIENIVR